jgi:hypothetical protein
MMTLFDRVLLRLERWREAVDRERDLVARLLATPGATTPLLVALLDELELERRRVTDLLTRLSCERHDPALLFPVRPRRALKVTTLAPAWRRRPRQFEGLR